MTKTTTHFARTAWLIGCLALSPTILANDDECTSESPCRYALSAHHDGIAQDPWREFHNDLGARFEARESVVEKSMRSAAPAADELIVDTSRENRAAADPGSRGLFLFWLLQKGNPRGQQ